MPGGTRKALFPDVRQCLAGRLIFIGFIAWNWKAGSARNAAPSLKLTLPEPRYRPQEWTDGPGAKPPFQIVRPPGRRGNRSVEAKEFPEPLTAKSQVRCGGHLVPGPQSVASFPVGDQAPGLCSLGHRSRDDVEVQDCTAWSASGVGRTRALRALRDGQHDGDDREDHEEQVDAESGESRLANIHVVLAPDIADHAFDPSISRRLTA